jgi:flagellar basal-body rod modification protein FlgD
MYNGTSEVNFTANSTYSQQAESTEGKSNLGKDSFFKLLTTQLKHQDPLKPMDNTKFISQMAQFSSLEQMNNMNQQLSQFLKVQGVAEGSALIGRTIETINSDTGEKIKGEVNKVGFEEGKMYAYLKNGMKVSADGISAVY